MQADTHQVDALAALFRDYPRLVALTGAGISLGSGIPTYRDAHGRWRHNEPIKHQEFITDDARRQRYWARSMRGWPIIRDARPNSAHLSLATLERAGYIDSIITQNVDRLHQRAGSQHVVDLHGRLDKVRCLDCGHVHCREAIQQQLELLNGGIHAVAERHTRPDGDVDIADSLVNATRLPVCARCQGALMPDVVFFGGTVPRERVDSCMQAVQDADALLVIGSSLQVYSGFRFCKRAVEQGKPLLIINPGKTRADDIATLKLEADCSTLLQGLLGSLPPLRAEA